MVGRYRQDQSYCGELCGGHGRQRHTRRFRREIGGVSDENEGVVAPVSFDLQAAAEAKTATYTSLNQTAERFSNKEEVLHDLRLENSDVLSTQSTLISTRHTLQGEVTQLTESLWDARAEPRNVDELRVAR